MFVIELCIYLNMSDVSDEFFPNVTTALKKNVSKNYNRRNRVLCLFF